MRSERGRCGDDETRDEHDHHPTPIILNIYTTTRCLHTDLNSNMRGGVVHPGPVVSGRQRAPASAREAGCGTGVRERRGGHR